MTGKQEQEQEETGFDPEEIFNEGVQYQQQQDDTLLREQIAEEMIASGQDPDEVQQLLFSQGTDVYAPRRGKGKGKRKCSARQWAKMPQICGGSRSGRRGGRQKHHTWAAIPSHYRRTFDPAPRGGYGATAKRYYHKKGGAKGLIAGLRSLIGPGVLLATVYNKYVERATQLKAAGAQLDGKLVDGWLSALMYDIKNRPTTSVTDRIKANMGKIVTPVVVGVGAKYAAKRVKLHPKVNQVAGMVAEGLIYNGIGNLVNAVLDPPANEPVRRMVQQPSPVPVQIAQTQAAPVNSFNSSPGGYY